MNTLSKKTLPEQTPIETGDKETVLFF